MTAQLHRCYKCKRVERVEGGNRAGLYCCGTLMTFRWIEGQYSPRTKCDIRCTSAKGHKCNCQCGGKNHAADWSQIGMPLSEVLAA